MTKIWIVLPAYNEEEALPPLFQSITEALNEEKKDYSIIVVNDGSKDKTGEMIENYSKTLPVIPVHNDGNKGLAETIRRGLVEAAIRAQDNDVIVAMDADNTHPAGLMLRMLQLIKEGNDIVIASRYREGAHIRGLSFFRRFLSYGASWLFRIAFPTPGVRDYTCGYRMYRASALKKLRQQKGDQLISAKGFSCMVDLLLNLRQLDLVFTEVPMVLRYDLKPGASKMRVFKTIIETLGLILKKKFTSETVR